MCVRVGARSWWHPAAPKRTWGASKHRNGAFFPPTNPMMRICDLRALAAATHAATHGALFSVDNTLMTGLLVRPLDLGADLVVTSCTKFACGHSDTMAGVVSARGQHNSARAYRQA